jgi:hypothetical protein
VIPRARSGGRCSPPPPVGAPGPKQGTSSPTREPGCCETAPAHCWTATRPRRSACSRTASSGLAITRPCSSGCGTSSARRSSTPGNALAAAVLDAAGGDYLRYFRPNDLEVLDCAYHVGYAYAEPGKPGKALPQLRFYVQNADTSAGGDEARKVLEARSSSRNCWPPRATPTRRWRSSGPPAHSWPSAPAPSRFATSTSRPPA